MLARCVRQSSRSDDKQDAEQDFDGEEALLELAAVESSTNQVSTRWLYTQLQGVHFSSSLLLASVGVLSAGGSTHGSTSRQAFCQVWRALPLGRRAAHWRRELELEPCAHGWGDRVLDLSIYLDLAHAKGVLFVFCPPSLVPRCVVLAFRPPPA